MLDLKIKGLIGDIYFKYSLNENFFTQYFKNNICYSENYSLDEKNNISIYKCTKNLDIKSFPKNFLLSKRF